MPMLHVVIPVYNAERFLQEAVDSVLNQPFKGIDIVLVNDGSTDSSPTLCDAIAAKEERVTVIHQKNGGVSVARNTGIEYILGCCQDEDYIAFLDADDVWIPNAFLGIPVTSVASKVDLIACSSNSSDETLTHFTEPAVYEESCCRGDASAVWKVKYHLGSNLYSARLLRKFNIRFFEGLKYCEDKIFISQCSFLADQIYFCSILLYIVRTNSGSAMQRARKLRSISYYLPIIDGWLRSDEFVSQYESVTGKHLRAGRILAGIYLMDMTADHYKQWGSRKEIEKVLREHPHYNLMVDFTYPDVSVRQCKKRDFLLEHPVLFRLLFMTIGTVDFTTRWLLSQDPFKTWWDKRKYPVTELPQY